MAVSHIMNNKAGLSYTSYAHSGLQIPVYAYGVGAEKFSGLYDNTGIFTRTIDGADRGRGVNRSKTKGRG